MRVAIYVRVSTKAQSTDMQLEEIERYITSRGWEKGLLYQDIGTGRSDQRPAYKRLMDDAAKGRVQAVIVWKLDRFGRSVKHLLTALQDLHAYGVAFISVRDHMDFTTPAGRMMVTMLAAIAEFEADLIRERVRTGVEAKIAKTGKWGRRPIEEKLPWDKRKQIHELFAQGKSYRSIAAITGVSATSVRSFCLRLMNQHERLAEVQRGTEACGPTLPKSAPPSEALLPHREDDRQSQSEAPSPQSLPETSTRPPSASPRA